MKKSASSYIAHGWHLFKKEWHFYVAAMMLIAGISLFDGFFGYDGIRGDENGNGMTITLATQIITMILGIGVIAASLDVVRDKKATYTRLFMGFVNIRLVVFFFLTYILSVIVVATGLIALIIPGVIAMVRVCLTQQLVVDTGCGPIDAVKQSFALTKGYFWFIMLLALFVILLNIVGALFFLVGLIVTMPISTLAFTSFYIDRYAAHTATSQS